MSPPFYRRFTRTQSVCLFIFRVLLFFFCIIYICAHFLSFPLSPPLLLLEIHFRARAFFLISNKWNGNLANERPLSESLLRSRRDENLKFPSSAGDFFYVNKPKIVLCACIINSGKFRISFSLRVRNFDVRF